MGDECVTMPVLSGPRKPAHASASEADGCATPSCAMKNSPILTSSALRAVPSGRMSAPGSEVLKLREGLSTCHHTTTATQRIAVASVARVVARRLMFLPFNYHSGAKIHFQLINYKKKALKNAR